MHLFLHCSSWLDSSTPFGNLAERVFFGKDDDFRDQRLKLIPKVRRRQERKRADKTRNLRSAQVMAEMMYLCYFVLSITYEVLSIVMPCKYALDDGMWARLSITIIVEPGSRLSGLFGR